MNARKGLSVLATIGVLGISGRDDGRRARRNPRVRSRRPARRSTKPIDKVDDAIDPKGPAEKAGRAIDRAVDD